MTTTRPWWEPVTLTEGGWAWWRMGGLSVWAQRAGRGWLVGAREGVLPPQDPAALSLGLGGEPPEDHELERFAARGEASPLRLSPHHAPRPVVVRPERPISLLPGATTRLFVALPVWARLSQGETLLERAVARPPDTWLGTKTEGTLGFAVRAPLRSDLADFHRSPQHALATVVITNDDQELLRLERLRLPAPSLSLYADAYGGLWADEVQVTHRGGGAPAQVRVVPGAPAAAPQVQRVSEARQPHDENAVIRAFATMFNPERA